MRGTNEWVLQHPWLWAIVQVPLSFIIAFRFFDSPWLPWLIIAALAYVVTGWSLSRGPGRTFLKWRLRR